MRASRDPGPGALDDDALEGTDAGEVRGAHYPRRRAQLGDADVGQGTVAAAGQGVLERRADRVEEKVAGVGQAAADDERAGVEDRAEVGQALRGPLRDRPEALQRGLVALAGRLRHLGAADALGAAAAELQQAPRHRGRHPGQVARLVDEGVAAGVLLPAAAVAAAAAAAVWDDPEVAHVRADAEPAPVELAVDDDAAADPGAEGHQYEEVLAAPGADPGLAPRGGVAVVLHV